MALIEKDGWKKKQILLRFWRLPRNVNKKHVRSKRHASLETKQIKASVPLSSATVVCSKMEGVWGAVLEWSVAKATTVYRDSIIKLFFWGAGVTRRTPFAVIFDDDKDGASNHQKTLKIWRLTCLVEMLRIVLDRNQSTSVGQCLKSCQAGPKHMNTRGNLIKGALCIWAFEMFGCKKRKGSHICFPVGSVQMAIRLCGLW